MRKSKRVAALALVATMGLFAAACGSDDKKSDGTTAPGGTTGDTVAPTGLKLGVAFDTGGRGDGTFNDLAGIGADRAKAELGATVDEVEASAAEDRKPNLENLTANGDDPVIAVGFLFSDDLAVVAAANPNTTYGIVDGYVDPAVAPNVKNLGFAEQEGSFLVGVAAALKSETGHIGFIGGQDGELIQRFEAGYRAGAEAAKPGIKIEVQYLGAVGDNAAWTSPDKAKEIATGWYNDGVDIIYTAAGGSGQGTIEAAVAADKWAIGVDSDQYSVVTDPEQKKHILTSMLKRVDVAVFEMAKAVQGGDKTGGFTTYNLAVDGVGYSTSGGFIDDIKDQIEAYKTKIISGEIKVPTVPAD